MSGIRAWIGARIDHSFDVTEEGRSGLRVVRPTGPTVHVYCVEPNQSAPFGLDDLEAALSEMPNAQFFVAIRRRVAHEVYEQARNIGVCVSGFGDLLEALANAYDIADFIGKDESYLRSRLKRNRHVVDIIRRGASAYEIVRESGLPPVTVVTIDHYELTAEEIYSLLDSYDHLTVDVIVSTNPYAMGFSQEAHDLASEAGVAIDTLAGLIDNMGKKFE